MPVIEGYDPTKELYLGAPLRLVCRSSGGFPPAELKWFKNGDEIPSESLETKAGSENHIDVVIREDDDGAEYRCDAVNFADTLATSIVLFLRPGASKAFLESIGASFHFIGFVFTYFTSLNFKIETLTVVLRKICAVLQRKTRLTNYDNRGKL